LLGLLNIEPSQTRYANNEYLKGILMSPAAKLRLGPLYACPDLLRERTEQIQMICILENMIAETALVDVCPAHVPQPVSSPNPILKRQQRKNLILPSKNPIFRSVFGPPT
jgi:hypothetical protein